MPVYAPQFNAVAAGIQHHQLQLQRQGRALASTQTLRLRLLKVMDHCRFDAIEFIDQPLNHGKLLELLDDFYCSAEAEKYEAPRDKRPLRAMQEAMEMLRQRLASSTPFSLDDAKLIHRCADQATERLRVCSPRALVHAAIQMNRLYAMRGDPAAFLGHVQPPNALQLRVA